LTDAARVAGAHEPSGYLKRREQWYVAQTLHHREKIAELHLRAQGFHPFFPQFRRTVRHARKLREVVAPVFPGYIFVIFDTERDRWHSINGTVGVARLLTALKRPVPVPAILSKPLSERSTFLAVSFWEPTYALGRPCGLWRVRLRVALACWSASTARGVFACC
jgi:hypothetical protein